MLVIGQVREATSPTGNDCTTATTDSDFGADYNLTNTSIACVPQFNDAF